MRDNWKRSWEVQRPWCRRKIKKKKQGQKNTTEKNISKKKILLRWCVRSGGCHRRCGGLGRNGSTIGTTRTFVWHTCDMTHSYMWYDTFQKNYVLYSSEARGGCSRSGRAYYMYIFIFMNVQKKSDFKTARTFVRTECMYIYVHIHIDGKKEIRGKLCMYIHIYINIYFTYT